MILGIRPGDTSLALPKFKGFRTRVWVTGLIWIPLRLDLKTVREDSNFCTTSLLAVYFCKIRGGAISAMCCTELWAGSPVWAVSLSLSSPRSIYNRSLEPGLVPATHPHPPPQPPPPTGFKILNTTCRNSVRIKVWCREHFILTLA